MSHVDHWQALAFRIRSLAEAAHLHAEWQNVSTTDNSGVFDPGRDLGDYCRDIFGEIDKFVKAYDATLPQTVHEAHDRFIRSASKAFEPGKNLRKTHSALVFLLAFESEISYLLAGHQEIIRARFERAMLHLSRLLVVDNDVRTKWQRAINGRGEVPCEALGAVHLLWHGIYAFKVDAKGARTDLVFNEPIDPSLYRKGIEGLVLTEWKVADDKVAAERFEEGRKQAELYKGGPLAGTELTAFRYVIVVSVDALPQTTIPDDFTIGGAVYRHINIAIAPPTPSKLARRK